MFIFSHSPCSFPLPVPRFSVDKWHSCRSQKKWLQTSVWTINTKRLTIDILSLLSDSTPAPFNCEVPAVFYIPSQLILKQIWPGEAHFDIYEGHTLEPTLSRISQFLFLEQHSLAKCYFADRKYTQINREKWSSAVVPKFWPLVTAF